MRSTHPAFWTDNRGFTMTETLVAVAVVALLAAIAIPSYQKYTARARDAEAKTNLASIYTAEMNFVTDSQTFTYCLVQIGVTPSVGDHYYGCGIMPPSFAGDAACGPTGNQPCATYVYDQGAPFASGTCGGIVAGVDGADGFPIQENIVVNAATPLVTFPAHSASVNFGGQTMASNVQFTAGCAGNVTSISGYDNWRIDNTDALVNPRNGI